MKTVRTTFLIGLLVALVGSIPANAATFTLAQLIAGEDFTIGTTQFTGWALDSNDTSADPTLITVDTIDDPGFPGFQINGNSELAGDEATLVYSFTVVTTDLKPVIAGAFLDLAGFNASPEGQINVDLVQTDEFGGLELEVFLNDGNDTQLKDAGALEGLVNSIAFETSVKLDLNAAGSVSVENYTTQIILLGGPNPDQPVLRGLTISEGTLSPTFDSDTREYTAAVPFDTASVSVTATADAGTNLTLNGQPITSGVASPPQSLSVGENELVIQLTAAEAESNYRVVVTRQSEDAATVEFTGTNATGILNLMVDGTLYDVEFLEGSASNVYGAYPGVYDFPVSGAADAVNAVVAALGTEPAVTTVGPGNSALFNIGFGSFSTPVMEVETEFVNVVQGYYQNEWMITGNPDSLWYERVQSFAKFTEVGTEPDAPTLTIANSGPGEVTISWSPATAGFVLQERAEVGSGSWTDSPSGSTNPVTLPTGGTSMFFQLRN